MSNISISPDLNAGFNEFVDDNVELFHKGQAGAYSRALLQVEEFSAFGRESTPFNLVSVSHNLYDERSYRMIGFHTQMRRLASVTTNYAFRLGFSESGTSVEIAIGDSQFTQPEEAFVPGAFDQLAIDLATLKETKQDGNLRNLGNIALPDFIAK